MRNRKKQSMAMLLAASMLFSSGAGALAEENSVGTTKSTAALSVEESTASEETKAAEEKKGGSETAAQSETASASEGGSDAAGKAEAAETAAQSEGPAASENSGTEAGKAEAPETGVESKETTSSETAGQSEETAASETAGQDKETAANGESESSGDGQTSSESTKESEMTAAAAGNETLPTETEAMKNQASDTAEERNAESETGEDKSETAETAGAKGETEKKSPANGDYSVGADGVTVEGSMFRVIDCVLTVKDGTYSAAVTLSGTGYDRLFVGTAEEAEAAQESQYIVYTLNENGEYVFQIPVAALDVPIAIAARSAKKGTWTEKGITFNSSSLQPEEGDGEEDSGKETEKPSDPASKVESDNVADELSETVPVDNTTALKDGTYIPDDFSFAKDTGTSKISISCSRVFVENGKAYAELVFSSKNYTKLKANGRVYTGSSDESTSYFVIPVKLGEANHIIGLTTAMSKDSWVGYSVTVTLSENSEPTGSLPVQPETPTEPSTEPGETIDTEKPTESESAKPSEIKDGNYSITVDTTTGKMFRVIAAVLTRKNGAMTARITLSGTGYDYLYMGSAADAASQKKNWIGYKENSDGQFVFEIPVSALDTEIQISAHSKKNDEWYERGITFRSSTAQLLEAGENPPSTEAPAKEEKPAKNDNKKEEESKYETDLSGGTSRVDSSTGLADGVYTPDKFSWSGGSGRTSISCSKVTVSGGQAYATIVFNSPNYGYVKANGNKYYPSYGAGTSSFTIPVRLNANNTIIGMTTAMSAAHEITYSIYVYIAAADKKSDSASGTEAVNPEKLSEKAPEIVGLEYKDEIQLNHAEHFKLYEYEEGIVLLEIDTGLTAESAEKTNADSADAQTESEEASDTQTESEEAADAQTEGDDMADAQSEILTDASESEEEALDTTTIMADLYKNRVLRYLLVPEGTEIPVGMEKEMIIVTLPATSVFTNSDEAIDILKQLDKTDLLTVEGKEGEDPDYKNMVLEHCDLAILKGISSAQQTENEDQNSAEATESTSEDQQTSAESTSENLDSAETTEATSKNQNSAEMTGEDQQTAAETEGQKENQPDAAWTELYKITDNLTTLGIPAILDCSDLEKTEEAKAEWLKIYGVLFGCEDTAEQLYQDMIQ